MLLFGCGSSRHVQERVGQGGVVARGGRGAVSESVWVGHWWAVHGQVPVRGGCYD